MQMSYSDLPFNNFCKLAKTSRSNKKFCKKRVLLMIKHCLGISEINSLPEWSERRKVYAYNKREQILFIQIAKFSTLKNSPLPLTQRTKVHRRALVLLSCLIPCPRCENFHTVFDRATWQHTRENPRHVRGLARIYDIRMAQFVLKIAKLSHIMGPPGSQELRSPSPIMAPA